MARVNDWFDEFVFRLQVRIPHAQWPRADEHGELPEDAVEYWDNFRRALIRVGATEPHADEASSIVSEMPDLYPSQVLPLVLEAVRKLRARELQPEAGPAIDTLEGARLASRDCPDCAGSGFAPRFVHPEILDKLRTHGGVVAPVGARVMIPCSCALGRLVAREIQPAGSARPVDTVDRYPTLRLRPDPWSDRPDCQYRHHPDHWDADSGTPIAPAEPFESPADLRRSTVGLAAQARPRRRFVPPDPREPRMDDARALPGPPVIRPDLPRDTDDPILLAELARVVELARVAGPQPDQPARPTQDAQPPRPDPAEPEPEYPGVSEGFEDF